MNKKQVEVEMLTIPRQMVVEVCAELAIERMRTAELEAENKALHLLIKGMDEDLCYLRNR